jgi:histidinol-phosphatase
MNADWRTRYELAVEAARAGGDFARQIYDQTFQSRDIEVIRKQDNSPVTIADRGAEQLIREMISKHFPNDGFLGEEFGDQPGTTGYRWIIDPIDGTKSFIRHVPIWATLIGLEFEGEQIAGAVYLPVFGQMYRALRGDGAYLDDVRIRTSNVTQLSDSILCYSSIQWFTKNGKQDEFLRLYQATGRQRGYGDFYGFVLVAQGSCDLMIEHGVNPWDVSATCAIIQEAGGRFTDWDGQPGILRPDVIASNGHLHEIAREFLRTT